MTFWALRATYNAIAGDHLDAHVKGGNGERSFFLTTALMRHYVLNKVMEIRILMTILRFITMNHLILLVLLPILRFLGTARKKVMMSDCQKKIR